MEVRHVTTTTVRYPSCCCSCGSHRVLVRQADGWWVCETCGVTADDDTPTTTTTGTREP